MHWVAWTTLLTLEDTNPATAIEAVVTSGVPGWVQHTFVWPPTASGCALCRSSLGAEKRLCPQSHEKAAESGRLGFCTPSEREPTNPHHL